MTPHWDHSAAYRNAFRDAYVRGYGEGYNHR